MDIATLERNARSGVYDLDPELLSPSGGIDPNRPKVKKRLDELAALLREDCILAAISAGLPRSHSRRIFDTVKEVAGDEGAQSVVNLMVRMVRAQM